MVKRKNSWQDAYTTGTAQLDLGDGIVIPLPVSGVLPGSPGPAGAGVPTGGAANQLIRKNAAGTTTEWVSPDRALVGLSNVDNTTDADKPVSAAGQAALNLKAPLASPAFTGTPTGITKGHVGLGAVDNTADVDKPVGTLTAAELVKKIAKGELFVSVIDAPYGADNTGVADATSAIIAAEAAAVAGGRPLLMPAGTYKTSGTIQIRCAVVADEATINYYGTGTILIVGDKSASAIITQRRRFLLPKVANKSRGAVAWVSTTVGIELVNLNACTIHVPQSRDSAIGLKCLGYGGGFAYNTIHLGSLNDNQVGCKLTQDETGWCNQNLVLGGRIEQNPVNGATTDDVNSTYIWFDTNSGTVSGANNNTFVGTSIENSVGGGGNSGYYRVIFGGRYNSLINCRWETGTGQTPRVLHKATSASNEINGGYDAYKIVEVVEAGGAPGLLRDGVGGFYRQTNTAGQLIPTAVNTTITTWPTSGLQRIAYDGAGNFTPRAGTWRIRARAAFSNNATGTRKLILSAAGSTQDVHEVPSAATTQTMQVYATVKFSGTQTFNVQVYQNSGADLALIATSPYVKLEAEWLGY